MSDKDSVIAVKCPVCGNIVSVNTRELVEGLAFCPKCKNRLTLVVLPSSDPRALSTLMYVQSMDKLNKLCEIMLEKIRKLLGV